MTKIELFRSIITDGPSNYLKTAIVCNCGRMCCIEFEDGLARREVRYVKDAPVLFATAELEQKCCPEIATEEGIEYYGINTEWAFTHSDLDQPLLLTEIACSVCRTVHLVLLDGHHKLYRAVVENKPFLPTHLMNKIGRYNFSCTEKAERNDR